VKLTSRVLSLLLFLPLLVRATFRFAKNRPVLCPPDDLT